MTPLRLLLVENNPDDAELVVEQLRRDGIACEWTRVEDEAAMKRALDESRWDAILSDFVMPRFSGSDALKTLRATGKDIPFIIVSGSVEDEVAVEAMRAGAQDFFRKDRLSRLGAALQREVREAQVRRERQEFQQSLADVEAQHSLVLQSIRDYAIFTIDLNGRMRSWNPGVKRLKGYDEAEFIGMPFAMLFTPEDRLKGQPEREMAVAAKEGRYEGEGWRQRKDGTLFYAVVTVTPLRDERGELRGFTKVARDITARKQLMDELRVAVRARDEFMSIASHELKTPITSLLLQLQTTLPIARALSSTSPEAARLVPKVETAIRQVGRLAGLVETLLDVSRITSGRLELHREELDLSALIGEVIERLEPQRRAAACDLNASVPPGVVGSFDRLRLDSALTNLLSNAFKFGSRAPVDVSLEDAGGQVTVTVRDRGIGIDPADQARIFQRFERAVPEKHYGGFGVGLWIVRQVVEAHGGRVSLESSPGQGTTFRLTLPKEPPRS